MLEVERFEKIMEYLREKKTAPVNVLAKRLFVSEATMRRDLSELERKGLVKRLHGGAILLDGANQELPLYLRERQNTDAKRMISEKASHHIVEGQTIFLDASSTAQYLIKYFENYQNLTIITNGLKTAQELNSLSHRIYCTGGLLLHNSSAYVGDFAADFVRNFNADIMFFSSRGVSESGQITDASREETYIRQVMLQQSRKHIFLCDHNKIGQVYCYNLCNVSQLDDYITDLYLFRIVTLSNVICAVLHPSACSRIPAVSVPRRARWLRNWTDSGNGSREA